MSTSQTMAAITVSTSVAAAHTCETYFQSRFIRSIVVDTSTTRRVSYDAILHEPFTYDTTGQQRLMGRNHDVILARLVLELFENIISQYESVAPIRLSGMGSREKPPPSRQTHKYSMNKDRTILSHTVSTTSRKDQSVKLQAFERRLAEF